MNTIFYYIIIIISGLIFGSFLNVVIYRIPISKSISKPPSSCPVCNHKIRFYDNIPLFSYLFLKGRCRDCKARISPRYPLVEAMTAFLFALSYYFNRLSSYLMLSVILISALIIVSFTDIEHGIIPNVVVLPLAVTGLVINIILIPQKWWVILAFAFGAFLFMLIISLVYPKGMGMGDVKLSFMAGSFLVEKIIPGLFIGFLAGSIYGLAMIIIKKKKFRQTIPFGPFISIGCVIALFFGGRIINWYLRFI
jgi:prepilin signal peptidase PulO-like enzyme (type II secretory pathway)